MATLNENIISEIKRRAAVFVAETFTTPTRADLLLTESVMLMGASIALQADAEDLHKETELLSSEQELASEDRWRAEHVRQQQQTSSDTL